mmetsp:Transcript_2402/g.6409  ORF Transcript_2402/g.6409 Transcript_2402/m.6409 type:complete len:300 (-) Transcript_2402:261-1160(-)
MRLELRDDFRENLQHIHNKRPPLLLLDRRELLFALLRDLQKRVARHVLHPRVRLVHELKQFVHHRLQKLPMRAQKPRVLADNIHDVGGDHRLVVFPALHFAQLQQVLDDGHQESLLFVLSNRPGNRADGPAQRIQVVPRPLRPHELQRQLVEHDFLRVQGVEPGQIDQSFPHGFVQRDRIGIFGRLPDDFAVLVLDNQNLLRLCHFGNHDVAQIRQDRRIKHEPGRGIGARGRGTQGHAHARRYLKDVGEEVRREPVPPLEAGLENLGIVDHADLQEILVTDAQGLLRLSRALIEERQM